MSGCVGCKRVHRARRLRAWAKDNLTPSGIRRQRLQAWAWQQPEIQEAVRRAEQGAQAPTRWAGGSQWQRP